MSPKNVGIKAIEIYIPSEFVNQSDLEKADGVSAGKYTIGLGQTNMAFVNDREDIYSMALTVTSNLLKNNSIDPNSIGRLEVGTETLLDKSKSVKSLLMTLFGGNYDIEGIDTVNACYGGTNALFNSINWIQSDAWDGRDAIVVAGDIAIYSEGAARPTGGAGTVALLVGPDAPIVFESARGSFMEHAYDFYKPNFTSEYPVVDGHFSLACYVKAFDHAYRAYSAKAIKKELEYPKDAAYSKPLSKDVVGMQFFDYNVFHVPTCKLVTKTYGRMMYNDYLADPKAFEGQEIDPAFSTMSYTDSLTNKAVEKAFVGLSKPLFKERVEQSLNVPTNIGNTYTASVYGALASLLFYIGNEKLQGKRIGLFSYGSGLASSLFSAKVVGDISAITKNLDIDNKLNNRFKRTPEEYIAAIALRESIHLQKSYEPKGTTEHLRSGTYYLVNIDDKYKREYKVKN
ncbi:hydroxymethylglutaryl-CoA synthase [Saccharomycopsis crataegensis]|uniref:Hydroxymethylglutaryl-CoA synthase n=1 Tax=Saccharomycopsis crataegensis TaxID=43959 RepID=A0AAV5QFY5_9ASCO|nr:hydroxymethylglutaryl-CoA synthase [Saccharomycopsis crataegensis]